MIGRLRGKLVTCSPGQVLLDVGGVGYDVRIPLSTFYELSSRNGRTATVRLHVHTHVREDALQLYGFATREERSAFERLIGIAGVGPRLALAILSGIGVDELRQAVARQDRQRLQKIPGIGKKTAERVLLELRDKALGGESESGTAGRGRPGPAPGPSSELRSDAVSALINLGYGREVADRAVETALEGGEDEPSLETVLRAALGALVR